VSADERALWADLLYKDILSGALVVIPPERVFLETPVFVAFHPVTLKARLIHDLRSLNVRLHAPASLAYEKAADALSKGSFGAKVDILSAFRHIGVAEEDRGSLAFRVGGVYLAWAALPFGLTHSPAVFSAALAHVVRKLRAGGLVIVVYVDDILVIGRTPQALDAAVARLLDELHDTGWSIALDKAFIHPCSRIVFLGIVVDFVADSLRVSVAKATKLGLLASSLRGKRKISLVALQKIGGTLSFLGTACPLCRFARLGINSASADAAKHHSGAVKVTGALLEDLSFWAANATSLPSFTTARTANVIALATDAAGEPYLGWGAVWWRGRESAPDIDAALRKVHAIRMAGVAQAVDGQALSGTLSISTSMSSSSLELEALLRALCAIEARHPGVLQGTKVSWYCDSQVAVAVMGSWRTKSTGVAKWLKRIFDLCTSLGTTVHPHWVARDLGWQPVADLLSRASWRARTAEYTMAEEDRAHAVHALGASDRDWDMFAADGNQAYSRFATRWPVAGALTNAFAAPWSGRKVWAFPPFGELDRVAAMVRAPGMDVVLIAPTDWTVPHGVPVIRTVPLGDIRLISSEGRRMTLTCPRPLSAHHICSPSA
jgi:ribonuclease HI